jgi:hypothetical protein
MDSLPRLSALFHNHRKNQKQTFMSKMQSSKLGDMPARERYIHVGEWVDAQIYDAECHKEAKEMVARWRMMGKKELKSIILPDDEPDNMCNSCNGTGEGSTPDTWCWSCNGSGAIIPKSYDYEG